MAQLANCGSVVVLPLSSVKPSNGNAVTDNFWPHRRQVVFLDGPDVTTAFINDNRIGIELGGSTTQVPLGFCNRSVFTTVGRTDLFSRLDRSPELLVLPFANL
jgi:hypothetical protein